MVKEKKIKEKGYKSKKSATFALQNQNRDPKLNRLI